MSHSPRRRVSSRTQSALHPRRKPRLRFERLEDRIVMAAWPTFSIGNLMLVEGTGGTIDATFTVSLSKASHRPLEVSYATSDGTAAAGSDYTAASGRLIFAGGETAKTLTVPILSDALNEVDESFLVTLSNPSKKSAIARGTGVATIVNDDPAPSIRINDRGLSESQGGTEPVTFTVALSAPSGQMVTVGYSTADGTAKAGSDYTQTAGTLTFQPGQTTQTVTVPVVNDALDENNETFFLNLSAPTNALVADAQGLATIVDDDATPTLSIDDASSTEGNSGVQALNFTVNLSAPSGRVITVNYATVANTALAGSDFTATSGTLTFQPGVTSQTVSVPILGDTLYEFDESFWLALSVPVNATLADTAGLGIIKNDDPLLPPPEMSISDVTMTEGDSGTAEAVFTVTLASPNNQVVRVSYGTADYSALVGSDYEDARGILTFLPGETSQTIRVSILGDTRDEADETFFVRLGAAVNATIVKGQGVGTIVDDDPTPSLSISDATVTEGDSTSTSNRANFTVTLSAPSNRVVAVRFGTADNSAKASSDYLAASGTLTFLPGQTSQTISVPILDGTVYEQNETFFLRLSTPLNATIANGEGVGTIVDDDPMPSLSISDATVTEGNIGESPSASFTVTLSAASDLPVTFSYTTADGTATAGSDYTPANRGLTFLPGQTSLTITVPILGDTDIEAHETFFIQLGNARGATITRGFALGTIVNDDLTQDLAFRIEDARIVEGNSGTSKLVFRVLLSSTSTVPEWVVFTTADGTATADDYMPQLSEHGTTFLPGMIEQTISITILGDTAVEPDEVFYVNLIRASQRIADAQAVGTLLNDDSSGA